MPEMLQNALNLLLIVVGFGLVITVHELGHFLAAKWAKVRVLAFAVGFGQALVSYRKGMGWRRGTSEPLYKALPEDKKALVSPTEYRLNWMPIGGYVKMLGQEDADPTAVSDEPDSFQQVAVGKRMVIISAGVFLNLVLAAILFIVVFLVGMREPAAVVGEVRAGSPAFSAGILPGDRIVSVNGTPPLGFSDLAIAAAMTGRGESMTLTTQRTRFTEDATSVETSTFTIEPEVGDQGPKVLQLGVTPGYDAAFMPRPTDQVFAQRFDALASRMGLVGEDISGKRITHINGKPLPSVEIAPGITSTTAHVIPQLLEPGSRTAQITIADPDDPASAFTATVPVRVAPITDRVLVPTVGGDPAPIEYNHYYGLTPLMQVDPSSTPTTDPEGAILPGDIFINIGGTLTPSVPQAIGIIRSHAGTSLTMTVLRDGTPTEVTVRVGDDGLVGFVPTYADAPILASLPEAMRQGDQYTTRLLSPIDAASRVSVPIPAGFRIERVGEVEVESLSHAMATIQSLALSGEMIFPLSGVLIDTGRPFETELRYPAPGLRWIENTPLEITGLTRLLNTLEKTTQASGPIDAIGMGLLRTKRALLNTYITFRRLIEGTVPVDQLQGPVGITHTGTILANRGLIYVLFFFALINVNLAVVNFLPLPIVDGGQFVMLLYEKLTGRPIPIALQQGIMMIGLIMIAGFFLFVTFNDIKRLLGL